MKENPFGNMVQTATSFVSRLRTKPQVSMGARIQPQEKCWSCVVLHVNADGRRPGTGGQEAGHGPSQMAGGSLTNTVYAF